MARAHDRCHNAVDGTIARASGTDGTVLRTRRKRADCFYPNSGPMLANSFSGRPG